MEALSRISQLELDGHLLQTLIQTMQDTGVNMVRGFFEISYFTKLIKTIHTFFTF